jgi:alkaline phosphatase D
MMHACAKLSWPTLVVASVLACAPAALGDGAPLFDPANRGVALDPAVALERIALGSCSREDWEQPIWDRVLEADPDLWIWLGDNVYADSTDPEEIRAAYAEQLANPDYRRVLGAVPVIGTWDDHDYGLNDGGIEHPRKSESQAALLDFLGEPEESARRTREGVYTLYDVGPEGQKVRVILLDARYHRESPGPDADVLGKAQWTWLEDALRTSDAQITLIGSGFQFLPEEHPYEKWANFPTARQRLLDVIARSGASGVMLMSGDRHLAEISRLDDPEIGYPLYEITASGMTHSYRGTPTETNPLRVGDNYPEENFGTISFEWGAEGPSVILTIHDAEGRVVVQERVALEALSVAP